MQLVFAQPSAAIAPLVSIFYLYRNDDSIIDGIERADVGQIRFMLKGHGALTFPGGYREPSPPIMINGPGTGAAAWHVEGPFHCLGLALRPQGWGALIGIPASERADHVTDGATIFGAEGVALLETLRALDTIEQMQPLVESFLLGRMRSIPPEHDRLCEAVRAWLAHPQPQHVSALYAALPWSPRQVERLVNQYFGAPPKLLERKFRALHAATALVDGGDIHEIAERFYDQSHMIREIRHFTGHTPGNIASRIDPVLAMTLKPGAFNELAPPGSPEAA
jgi:AraC-like DNA-binding protein